MKLTDRSAAILLPLLPLFCLLVPLLAALAAPPAAAVPVDQQGRLCHLPGSEEGLRCLSVAVPLDYRAGSPAGAATLKLHVTVAPAFREAARPDPLFILAGGPGEAGSDVLPLLGNTFRRVRATRDIVFIDQRGTGRSGKLDCDSEAEADTLSDADEERDLLACLAANRQPLGAYSTANAARDLERVRLALGYGKVNLWGGSYGTRLAQAYARLYPGSVRALMLDGVAAPDQIIPAGGRDGQAALDLLFRQCAQDAACNQAYPALRSEFAALAARVAAGPIRLNLPDPRTARQVDVTVTSARFLSIVHNVLYSAQDSRRLPFLIHSAYQGRWAPFIARRNVAADYSTQGGVATVLHLAVVCAEDMPRLTAALEADDARASFMGSERITRMREICKAVKVTAPTAVAPAVPAPPAQPATIAAPVLMLSGALDPVTPPRRAVAAKAYMAAAQHVVVNNAGHGISQLGCAPRLLREFLDAPARPLDAKCLTDIPAPTFQVGSAGPQP